ncbi:MAG: replicative helicase [Pseudomonadota bacterium]|jgi:replicative DNA helicase
MDERAAHVPPHSVEAEQSVLGALLIDNRAFDNVADRLVPASFYRAEHRTIYAATASLITAGKPADIITVYEVLQRQGLAEDAGGLRYLNELAQSVPGSANVGRYADIVAQRAQCREAIAIARDLQQSAYDAIDLAAASDKAVQALLALQQGHGDGNPVPLADLLPPWVDQLQARAEGENDAIPTGLADCDALFSGGLRRGELVVIGSRPSMGKTGLCHTLARGFSRAAPVLVLSMEDSLNMLVARQMAATGRINLADIRNPANARGPLWEGVTRGMEALSALPIHVDDQASLTLREVRRKAQFVRSRRGDVGVVIIDYLQLMEEPGDESRAYELNRISRGLKRMAKEMQCAVVLLSQLSRKADETDGPPRIDHLAESGGIEQAADIIGLLWRESRRKPRPDNKHAGQIEWAKNKNGPTDTVQLWFDGATQRWESAGYAHA